MFAELLAVAPVATIATTTLARNTTRLTERTNLFTAASSGDVIRKL
jgi:hypothetical protein